MWIKLDDAMLENPKVAAAGPIGFALHVAGIIYAARNLTDGFIPYGHARRLLATDWTEDHESGRVQVWELSAASGMHGESGGEVIEHIIDVLLGIGLWDSVPHGYQIHDYLDYNPSRDEVLAMRAERQESGRRGGLAKAKAKATKPSSSLAKPLAKSWQNSTPQPVPAPVAVVLSKTASSSGRGTMRGLEPESLSSVLPAVVAGLRVER